MDRRAKLQQKIRNKREAEAQVQANARAEREAQAQAQREAEAQPKLTSAQKKKAKERAKKKAKKIEEAKEGGYYVDKQQLKRKLAEHTIDKINFGIEEQNKLIDLTVNYNERNPLTIEIDNTKGERARARNLKETIDWNFITDYQSKLFRRDLDERMVMEEAYEEYGRRIREIPSRWEKEKEEVERQIDINRRFNEYMEKREQKKRQKEINRQSAIEGRYPKIRARELLEGGEYGIFPQKTEYDRVGQRKTFTDESSFLLSELGRLEEGALAKRFKQYKVSKDFNQPNADKFGLNDDGTPRSRKQFAHRFRGKTEAEVSDMIDQEVRERTPAQRGAFMGRASRVLEGQDITERRGVGVGVDAGGVARVGAGEFISSELARQDIEQIEPKSVGFIGKEFTPDNMRRVGAMSREETERGEGLLGIRQRREQQYKKEWSADGTTLRNYGFGVIDQRAILNQRETQDKLLNAVAMNIQALTEGKTPIIEADEEQSFQEDENTFGRRGTQETEKYLTRKSNIGNIEVEFRQTEPYIQAQNNYALQGRFIDIFEKEPFTLGYLQQMKNPSNDKDFVSGVGSNFVNYVDTDLTMVYGDRATGFNPYLNRFQQLRSQGILPLQFLLNTGNGNILKFESDKPIAQERAINGVGAISVMNEVMMGGRVAFIGHTNPYNTDASIVSKGAVQSGSAQGYGFGFINVFNNPFIPEENNIQPLVEQNQIVDMTTPRTDIYNIATRDTTAGRSDLTGGGITLEEDYRTTITDTSVTPPKVRGQKIFVDRIEKGGVDETQPYQEQIRKGTFLPTRVAQDSGRILKANLRAQQLRASSFPTIALQKKKRFGFQMFN